MIVAVTGHRPEKIVNWQYLNHQFATAFQDFGVKTVIQGMSAGVDLHSAKIAYNLGIPFVCARPWKGHQPRKCDAEDYRQAMLHAQTVINVTDFEDYPGPWVYQKRNEWMVDNAEILIAYWDGSSGGTANCVKYAIKKELPIWRIDPATHEVGWIAYGPQTKTLHK